MKHLEVHQKYSAACRIFNSLLGVSSGDETLALMLDMLHEVLIIIFVLIRSTLWTRSSAVPTSVGAILRPAVNTDTGAGINPATSYPISD